MLPYARCTTLILLCAFSSLVIHACGTDEGSANGAPADTVVGPGGDGGVTGDSAIEETTIPDSDPTPDAVPPGPDGTSDSEVGEPLCDCQEWEYCDGEDQCIQDVCDQGQTTCESVTEQKICNADGSSFDVAPCPTDQTCYLGICQAPVCSPEDPPTCEAGQQKVCNSIGTDWTLLPCPGGSACLDGACEPMEPNVILILDTSGSMNAVNDAGDMPDDCEGDDCTPWTWPSCDDPESPETRLGRAKVGLQSVVSSDAASKVRMALQRFPQKFDLFKLLGQSDPTCGGVPLVGFDLFSPDNASVNESHEIEDVVTSLPEIMPVPFGSDAAATNAEILTWIDFQHTYEPTGVSCTSLTKCENPIANKACIDGACSLGVDPELRAMGQTPLGRALFYAGEIFRQVVVVQGQACTETADCGSPHYSCDEGVCHDPLRGCRPNVIIVFSDGAESIDTFPDDFFNPRIQAKRLHYGLGCGSDDDCANGASCTDGYCQVPTEGLPSGSYQVLPEDKCFKGEVVAEADCDTAPGAAEVCCKTRGYCHLTDVPCANNTVCLPYPYPSGPAQTTNGTCEELGEDFVDDKGANLVRDAAGNPITATIHVVDASAAPTSASLVASLGGGEHVPVDLDNLEGLIEGFLPLLDVKTNLEGCQ